MSARARLQRRKGERGVALLIVIVSLLILTAVATEFVYSSSVDLRMAANQRDDLRAHYMAHSGIGMARLILSFQKQVDSIQLPPGIGDLLAGIQPPPAGGAAPAFSPSGFNLQLWKLAR